MKTNNFVFNFNAPVGKMIIDNEWIKIERDKDGFATKKCLDFMFSNLPFVVVGKDRDGLVIYDVIYDLRYQRTFREQLKRNEKYTHYLLIPNWSEEVINDV